MTRKRHYRYKRQRQNNSIIYIGVGIVAVLAAIRVGLIDSATSGIVGWVIILGMGLTGLWILWALGRQFFSSFGKSRYPTRTERKRMRHQRKEKPSSRNVLGREMPEQNDQ